MGIVSLFEVQLPLPLAVLESTAFPVRGRCCTDAPSHDNANPLKHLWVSFG